MRAVQEYRRGSDALTVATATCRDRGRAGLVLLRLSLSRGEALCGLTPGHTVLRGLERVRNVRGLRRPRMQPILLQQQVQVPPVVLGQVHLLDGPPKPVLEVQNRVVTRDILDLNRGVRANLMMQEIAHVMKRVEFAAAAGDDLSTHK